MPTDIPWSADAEQALLSCCLMHEDGSILTKALSQGLTGASFYDPRNRTIFDTLVGLQKAKRSTSIEVLAEELKNAKQFDGIGGFSYLVEVSQKSATTAQVTYFIERVRDTQIQRRVMEMARHALDQSAAYKGSISDLLAGLRTEIDLIAKIETSGVTDRPVTSFGVPPDGDPSILLGNRYLNRGDGMLMVSSSGMGKSSMSIQAAVEWALGRPFFGITPNGPLKSIIIQAEDSDGDVGEVWASIQAGLGLTADQVKLVSQRVIIITERVKRGEPFIALVRALVDKHKPDLVWINPLLSFMDGDITDAHDAGKFLREGLNAVNDPPSFGYVVVHHTNKPPSAKDKKAGGRAWNEVMYDGAGSAELTNWARAVITLKATDVKGEFMMILAKRGSRAGVVVEVISDAGIKHLETTTEIPLKHATGTIEIPGRKKPLPMILWLYREGSSAPEPEQETEGRTPRPRKQRYIVEQFLSNFADPDEEGTHLAEAMRGATQTDGLTKGIFNEARIDAMNDGHLVQLEDKTYRLTPAGLILKQKYLSKQS